MITNNKTTRVSKKLLFMLGTTLGVAHYLIWNFIGYLGVILGNTKSQQGFLSSLLNITGITGILWGYLADKYGKNIFMFLGMFFLATFTSTLLFVTDPTSLIILGCIMFLFGYSAFFPAWNGFLGDLTENGQRGGLIGKLTSASYIAAIFIFILLALVMDNVTITETLVIRLPFLISLIFYVLSIVIFIVLLIELNTKKRRKTQQKASNHSQEDSKSIDRHNPSQLTVHELFQYMINHKEFIRFLLIVFFYHFTITLLWPLSPFIILKVSENSPLGKWLSIAIQWSFFAAPIAIFSTLGGSKGDRVGRKPILLVLRFFMVVGPVTWIFALISSNSIFLIVGSLLMGIGVGSDISATSLSLDLADNVSPSLKSSYNSCLMFILSLAAFIGPVISGFATDYLIDTLHNTETTTYIIILLGIISLRFISWLGHFWLIVPARKD